jgi:nitrilase
MTSPSNSRLKVAVAQVHTKSTLSETLVDLRDRTSIAEKEDVSIILFPEAYLGGYPRQCSFGAAVGSRSDEGREQFLRYYNSSVDLGDTPEGAGDAWIEKKLPANKITGIRGDGTREILEETAKLTGVFIVTGCVERAGGSMYCTSLFIDPLQGMVAKRRKVMPTGSERLVWSQGQPSTLKVVSTVIKGVKVVMGSAICWENYMPLLRYSLYAQGVNLWLAPTADQRPVIWESLMRTVACEGRCWVMSANQCIKTSKLPDWISGKTTGSHVNAGQVNGTASSPPSSRPTMDGGRRRSVTTRTDDNHEIAWRLQHIDEDATTTLSPKEQVAETDDFACRGGSLIVSPLGATVAGPSWDNDDDMIYAELDFDDCARGKLDFDASGHYARLDAFHLTVDGLDLNPPP